jgi:transposase
MDDQTDGFRRGVSRRVEVYVGTPRRRWPDALRAQIVSESFVSGTVVTQLARCHGCQPQQIHDWRKLARQGLLALPAAAMEIVPLLTDGALTVPVAVSEPASAARAEIVIEFDGVKVQVRGRPGSDGLADVFAALRKARAC